MKILFAGGGTAGHINPALSIAAYARKLAPDADILFIGKKGNMEEKLVPDAGFDIEFIDVEGLKRRLTLENIRVIFKTIRAISKCKKIIRRFRPDVVICTGGYVSGAVIYAAHAMRIPSIIHEQNVYPGVTVRISARYADVVATSFKETSRHVKHAEKCVFTGNPVREEIITMGRQAARKALGLDERPFLLAFGGSLGAQRINDAVIGYIKMGAYKSDVQLLFGTGTRNYEEVMQSLSDANIKIEKYPNIKIVPYIYNMSEAMAAADIVISRAGAITISEITALGKAAILVPSPNVVHDHQKTNANLLEKLGAAVVIDDSDLTPELLKDKIDYLLGNKETLYNMGKNAKKLGVTDAAAKIYDIARQLCS